MNANAALLRPGWAAAFRERGLQLCFDGRFITVTDRRGGLLLPADRAVVREYLTPQAAVTAVTGDYIRISRAVTTEDSQ